MRGPLADRTAVEDMLRYATLVEQHAADGLDALDEVARHGVLWELAVIGEAANRVSPELRRAHPEVPWRRIVDQRNFLVHSYDRIRRPKVLEAISALPELRSQLTTVLEELPDWPD